MFIKRLFPQRWATIVAWTGAALAWGSVGVAITEPGSGTDEATPQTSPATEPRNTIERSALPAMPESGLVVIRYTPVDAPEPEVIVNTVMRTAAATAAPRVTSSGS